MAAAHARHSWRPKGGEKELGAEPEMNANSGINQDENTTATRMWPLIRGVSSEMLSP
jgi:hypothetical protein